MKYKIYEMVNPSVLKRTEPDGYYIKTVEPITLVEPDDLWLHLKLEYGSLDEAINDIETHKDKMSGDYTVIPVITL